MNYKKSTYKVTLILALITPLKAYASISSSENCKPEEATETFLSYSDFKWTYSIDEMKQKFTDIYSSEKRLAKRAYLKEGTDEIFLPNPAFRGGDVKIEKRSIEVIASHIKAALKKNVIDFVFFPDMGHSHFFIPQEKFNNFYSKFNTIQFKEAYEQMFKDKEIKIFYHTAEQLQMLDQDRKPIEDDRLKFRLKTRNLVGENKVNGKISFLQNPNSAYNTANDLNGYHQWGAGFILSANKKGCFYYEHNGQQVNFDISLQDLKAIGFASTNN